MVSDIIHYVLSREGAYWWMLWVWDHPSSNRGRVRDGLQETDLNGMWGTFGGFNYDSLFNYLITYCISHCYFKFILCDLYLLDDFCSLYLFIYFGDYFAEILVILKCYLFSDAQGEYLSGGEF